MIMEYIFSYLAVGYGELVQLCDPILVMSCFAGLGVLMSVLTLGSSKISACSVKSSNDDKGSTPRKRRVLIVIAHPDDECMFFGPTILHFTQKEDALIYLLCLSTGDFYKEGKQRTNELWLSCEKLGIPAENITLYRCDDLPDNPSVLWPTMHTSRIINRHIHSLDVNMIVTFDSRGVSGHLNHFAIFNALEHLIEEEELPPCCDVYYLDSVNIFRKYSSVLDLFWSYTFSRCAFTVTCKQLRTIRSAMKAHASQYVWFRKLYIFFSRYVLINTLTKVN